MPRFVGCNLGIMLQGQLNIVQPFQETVTNEVIDLK
jgi:hypothetical protein